MITRLVSLGNVIIDIVAEVEALPERGGDCWPPVLTSRCRHHELMWSTLSNGCRSAGLNVSPV